MKFAGVPKIPDRSQPLVRRSSPYCGDIGRTYCCLVSFFPIVDRCSCEDIARETYAMVRRWTESEFCTWQNSVRRQDIPKVYIHCTKPGDGHTSCKVWLASGKRRRSSDEGKTRNPLKFTGVARTCQQISAVSRPTFTILRGHVEDILLVNTFFPVVDKCLNCEDIARQSCAMVPRWRFLATFLRSVFQRAACSRFQTCILNSL